MNEEQTALFNKAITDNQNLQQQVAQLQGAVGTVIQQRDYYKAAAEQLIEERDQALAGMGRWVNHVDEMLKQREESNG